MRVRVGKDDAAESFRCCPYGATPGIPSQEDAIFVKYFAQKGTIRPPSYTWRLHRRSR